MKQTWPAPERNKQPILDVLRRMLPATGTVLELSSGSGQHAAYFAEQLPNLTWQPSDIDSENLASTRAWVQDANLTNLRAPLRIDVCEADWGVETVDAIFNANMIHIAPWASAEGLLRGAGRHLVPDGVLILYGPFRISGKHSAESNARFDEDLRRRNAAWGVRDIDDVLALAGREDLRFAERIEMPANNQILVFIRPGRALAAPGTRPSR